MKLRSGCVAVVLCVSSVCAQHAPAPTSDAIWIEGEDATTKNVTQHSWYNSVTTDVLSGTRWLSHFDENKEGTASYTFDVQVEDEYTFWLRANPVASKLSVRLDDRTEWVPIDFGDDLRGRTNIAADGKPDLRFIAWINAGTMYLSQGSHTLTFRMHSTAQHHGAIDCFVLTRIPFVPSGVTKPQIRVAPPEPDEWFPVVMGDDTLSDESIIDMSGLIDAPAGKHGFLHRMGSDLQFAYGDGPVKFWGVNAHPMGRTHEEMSHAARWLRKHGINIVRQHTVIDAVGVFRPDGTLNPARLDRYDRWFAALKEQGIYTTWSVVYPHHGAFLQKGDIDDALFAELDKLDQQRDGNRQPIVSNDFINLDRSIQDAAWNYFDVMLNHENPYTGLKYKDDPALAMVEIQNESNVFFFTLNVLSDPNNAPILSKMMRTRFFDFIKDKYELKRNVDAAWNHQWQPNDDWDNGELALQGAHHWGEDGPKYEYTGQLQRTADYIEFLASIQREYFDRRIAQLRAAGFRGVTVTTAWKSGGPAASLANLYCDVAADCIDRHNYFGGGVGQHIIDEGPVYLNTHLDKPGRGLLAVGMFQVYDRAFAYSEWTNMPPNPWRAETAPLVAFYGFGLQGWDASYHFVLDTARMGDGWPGGRKYATQTPHYIGQFPAIAFALYNKHIQEGDVVALREATYSKIFSGKDSLGQSLSGGGFDAKELTGSLTTKPEALAMGKVAITFGMESAIELDADQFHDAASQTITSNTGELVWHYGDRVVEVRTPKTQGIIGFAGRQDWTLPSVDAHVETQYVSLLFTPLDNLDLVESKHILITAMARDKQTGTEYSSDLKTLTKMGQPPLLMQPVQATLKIHGSTPTHVRPVDFFGVPRDEQIPIASDGTFTINGRWQTYYYEVRRN
ncbi:MAG: hypothetical protein H6815_14260 [Phycisphaeraceae bacterium]|nr:hypothetical protein [Phycisphaerales bacterium]MCB9861604.1 hypothetical protein [Phycisphaeraceae bacterium]